MSQRITTGGVYWMPAFARMSGCGMRITHHLKQREAVGHPSRPQAARSAVGHRPRITHPRKGEPPRVNDSQKLERKRPRLVVLFLVQLGRLVVIDARGDS